jgi:POT family proton-dependent oligopeptide transporter
MAIPTPQGSAPAEAPRDGFFGHPRGLATLFFTEFWERFSFYGLRPLLALFMTAATVKGGLGYPTSRATAIFGLYASAVYLASLPGGWIADRLLGQRRAVFYGGCFIALGQFSLAIHSHTAFFLGLVLMIAGTGLLKPNVSTMVGELYPETGPDAGARRDAGFSIFYMGINLGALLAPIFSGWLGERVDWHVGFASAGVGMIIGLVQYRMGWRYLGSAGLRPNATLDPRARRRALMLLWSALAAAVLVVAAFAAGAIQASAEHLADGAGVIILATAIVYFGYQILGGGLAGDEKKRMGAISVLFLFAAIFWSGFEQAATSLNLFARDLTDRVVFGWEMPVSFLQAVNPFFIVAFAPVFALVWQRMGKRNPSSPTKFGLGLVFLGLGFLVLSAATLTSIGHSVMGPGVTPHKVSPLWLVLTYLFHTFGELCLSPVGLSTITKLAPHRKVSQMMGIWFMSISLGEVVAGQVAGTYEKLPLFGTFGAVAATSVAAGLVLLLLARPLRRLIGHAEGN